MGSALAVVGR